MLKIEKIKNVRMYRFDAVGFHEAGRSQAPCEQKDLGISWHYDSSGLMQIMMVFFL